MQDFIVAVRCQNLVRRPNLCNRTGTLCPHLHNDLLFSLKIELSHFVKIFMMGEKYHLFEQICGDAVTN